MGTVVCGTEFWLGTIYGLGAPPLVTHQTAAGYRFLPDQHLRRFGKRIDYNSAGLRSEALRGPATEWIRILCLGDSVTNGGATTDQADTYPYQLERELAHSGLKVQTLNASAGGWAPANEAEFLREQGLFGSTLVVWELGTHDLYGGFSNPDTDDPNFPERPPFSATTELFSRYLLPRLVGTFRDDSPLPGPAYDEVERANCLMLLNSTAGMIRSRGAKLVFLLIPESREFDEPNYAAVAKREFLLETRRMKVPVISPYEELLASRKVGRNPFRDAIHPNTLGNEIMAKAVAKYLLAAETVR